jgi:hypothetical protein
MTRTGLLLLAAIALAGCRLDPYVIWGDGGPRDGGDGDGATGDASGLDAAPPCIPPGTEEICNELDDDCDGVVDNGFDKQNDPSNCGTCGRICGEPNASVVCQAGECVRLGCIPGFADVDPDLPGCEYQCPLFPPATEEACNGVDDDCDGAVDEPEDLEPPPQGICRTTPGTPCAGVGMVCESRGNPPVKTWYCDYPATVEHDPLVPNGIVLNEARCDGQDGDCDGAVDEGFPDLGQACDNGRIGACRDAGERACDPLDPTRTFCDLSVLPDADPLAPRPEVCNGADDNCDGIVDNPDATDLERVLDDMVHVTHHGLDFWIYRYEASRPDATAALPGASGARACSNPDVLPWSNVTYAEAELACLAVGKRLCTAAEWRAACEGPGGWSYPYGDVYEPGTCNGVDLDGIPGGTDDDVLLATGEAAACESDDGAFDLSGNLREWTADLRSVTGDGEPVYVVRGGEYQTPYPGLTCAFDFAQAVGSVPLPSVGFRCCSDVAP